MKPNIGRGISRIWVVFIVLVELTYGGIFAESVSHNSDAPYAPFVITAILIPLLGYVIKRVVAWIAHGFSD